MLSAKYLVATSQPTLAPPPRLIKLGLGGWRRAQFPYLLLTRSLSGLLWSLSWWDVIDEYLLLGGALMFDDIERLQRQGVRAVLNLSAERPDNQSRLYAARMDYLWLPVLDTLPPTVEQIVQGLLWIEQQVNASHAVYIHCTAGIGRSVTLLACWYMYTRGMNVSQGLHFIKRRRPQVAPTRWQLRRLEEFALLLRHASGRLSKVREAVSGPQSTPPTAYVSSFLP